MIPAEIELLTEDLELEEAMLSKNYQMHLEEECITGYVDEIEAMRQVVFKILSTERYDCQVYSWDYGVELKELFGRPPTFVIPEIKRRITEALLQDERITAVDTFSFVRSGRTIRAAFIVHTVFGEIEADREVEI